MSTREEDLKRLEEIQKELEKDLSWKEVSELAIETNKIVLRALDWAFESKEDND